MAAIEQAPQRIPPPVRADWISEITPEKPLLHLPLAEIWRYRDLIFLTVWRDFISVHKQTIFGPLWYFAQPLVSTVVYQIVFGKIAQLPDQQHSAVPLLHVGNCHLVLFFRVSQPHFYDFLVQRGALHQSVLSPSHHSDRAVHQQYLAVPDPVSSSFSVFYFYFLAKGAPIHPSYRIVIIPFLVLQTALLGLGVGCLISALSTRFRDLQVAVAPAIQLWMYASCIFYPRSLVPENLQWLMTLNPIVPIIEGFRFALMGQGQVEIYQWLASLAVTAILLIIGLVEFGRAEKTFADTI